MRPDFHFEWDPAKERQNLRKHRYSFRSAMSVFRDPNQMTLFDIRHSVTEDRWITIGLDASGILRVVVHTYTAIDPNTILIRMISARSATRKETAQYGRR